MSLSSYLAKNYLTASAPSSSSSSTTKKRKRKAVPQTGLIIADDDAPGWSHPRENASDDETPITSNHGSSSEFRKSKKSSWKTVGVPALQPQNEDNAEAERIIQEAAAENSAALHVDEEPTIEESRGGLQTRDEAAAQSAKRKRDEAAQWARESQDGSSKNKNKNKVEETVYRDATGRRIDISMRRSEAKKEMDEKARKELEEKEAQKGDIQLLAQAKRREELDEARFMTVARGVDDIQMNEELKEVERWNDPAMQFLRKEKKGKSSSGKPLYKGAAAPNRYGIRPGYRWDGVDRGNGWEAERFKGENRRVRNRELDFQWQMDT
ncbi:hypothetical protein EAF04_010065 [Stromatinia cepivora]|nr:hypothetical protein EAF04_010065 [Stromatinia cepivora]